MARLFLTSDIILTFYSLLENPAMHNFESALSSGPLKNPIVTRSPDALVVRFVGDSGDGMQLVGSLFADTCALAGNDIRTLPDFPAEIRAPGGTIAGVSGYQVQIA